MNMTGSVSSTASTIAPPRRPDRERRVSRERADAPAVAAIVSSLHGRTGKTLLARVLADYFVLSGARPLLFDTDVVDEPLRASFPYDTVTVDLADTRDQMKLFDTLAIRAPEARVADVSHRDTRKFFKLMQESHFVAEARAREVEPVIFCIADRNPDAWEEARVLRERFDCTFVLVENVYVGRIKDLTRRSPGYRAFDDHDLRMTLLQLDADIADAVEEQGLSLSDIVAQPLSRRDAERPPVRGELSFEQRETLRAWLIGVFRDIHRVRRAVEGRAPSLMPATP